MPGRRQRSECSIKGKLGELRFKVVGTKHPMQRIVDSFNKLSDDKAAFVKLVRKQEPGFFWTSSVSFSEFVDYLVSDKVDSELVVPHWKTCRVCQPPLRPNLILKSEHLKSDLNFLTEKFQLDPFEIFQIPDEESVDGMSDEAKALFTTLRQDQIFRIFDIFRLDHELFGYDPSAFIKLGS